MSLEGRVTGHHLRYYRAKVYGQASKGLTAMEILSQMEKAAPSNRSKELKTGFSRAEQHSQT